MSYSPRTKQSHLRSNRCGTIRRGSAAVECAFVIPIIIMVMFGVLETCSAIFLKESVTLAAYEGARAGVRRSAEAEDVTERCEAVLAARNITGATIVVTPDDFSELEALDKIVVTVTAPTEGNSTYVFDFFVAKEVSGRVTMVREFDYPEEPEE